MNNYFLLEDGIFSQHKDTHYLQTADTARILVCSDTHENSDVLMKIAAAAGNCDALLFAGDGVRDLLDIIEIIHAAPENILPPFIALVAGNCDLQRHTLQYNNGEFVSLTIPHEIYITIAQTRILLTHGHLAAVEKGTSELRAAAKDQNCSIALYGHTHVPDSEQLHDILTLNPGSPVRPRGGSAKSYAILTLTAGKRPAVHFYTVE